MATVNVAPGAAASDVVLSEQTLFAVLKGGIWFSTDGGTTYIPLDRDGRIILASGLTVKIQNRREPIAQFAYMPA